MKKLLIATIFLLVVSAAPLLFTVPGATVSAVSQKDLIKDAECQEGENRKCVGTYCDTAAPPSQRPSNCQPAPGECNDAACNIVNRYVNPVIRLLAAVAGVAIAIGIILGGIQYAGSAGDPQKVAAAKNRIRNSIVALIVFFFLWALLRFLIPGEGLLRGA